MVGHTPATVITAITAITQPLTALAATPKC